jgi:site-specific DNA recombinase
MKENHASQPQRGIIIYSRISRDKSALNRNDVSLEAQADLGKAYARLEGLNVLGVFCEIMSGKSIANRPKFNEALSLAVREKAVLWIYSVSRAGRNVADICQMVDQLNISGADLVSHCERIDTNSAAGRMLLAVLSSFAQYEREINSERTTMALDAKAAKGERLGGRIPYGWECNDGVHLEEVQFEQRIIRRMQRDRKEGWSYRKIAEHLNADGVPSKMGKQWRAKAIHGILKRTAKRNLCTNLCSA